MNIRNSIFLSLLIVSAGVSRAQGYYDDDIYFNSSKDKDKNVELAKKQASEAKQRSTNGYILYPVADYAAADTYAPEGSSKMSVDDYNRRGIFGRDTLSSKVKTGESKDFAYTRQIEKYYNPAIVVGSNDSELAELYYAQPANVNIYVNTPSFGYWGYPYSWGGWYDYWSPGYWGYNFWGPAWSWSPAWSWGPTWAWGPSWGWGPSWNWGPSWSWGPSWGWGPSWSWAPARPYNPRHPGAIGNNRPSYGIANRPAGNSHFNNNGYRPAYNSNRHNGSVSNPAYNSNSNSTNRDNNSYSRPGRNNNNNSYRNNNNSNNSYRSNSGSYRSSGGSYNSGGSRSSGGGRGRH